MQPTEPLDMEPIKARVQAATPGPWASRYDVWESREVNDDWESITGHCNSSDDVAFIAHARADIPALIAEVERLRSRLACIIDVADRYIDINQNELPVGAQRLELSPVFVRALANGTATTLPENVRPANVAT